jgi:hypothetical protein
MMPRPMSTHNPQSVMEELKLQAQRKASLRMFYAATDVFRDYRGPYAAETAVEREKLAEEYHAMAKAAEEARWGAGGVMPTVAPPPRAGAPAAPKPATPRPPLPPRPKPATPAKPATTPATGAAKTARPPKAPEYQLDGDNMIFPCRWCKEPVTTPKAQAGKYMPCPKCDGLLSIPKL